MTLTADMTRVAPVNAAKWGLTSLYGEALQLSTAIDLAKEEHRFDKSVCNAKVQYLATKVLKHAELLFFHQYPQEDVLIATLVRGVRLLYTGIDYSTDREEDLRVWEHSLGLLRNLISRAIRGIGDYHDGAEEYAETLEALHGLRAHLQAVQDVLDLWSR